MNNQKEKTKILKKIILTFFILIFSITNCGEPGSKEDGSYDIRPG